MSNRYPGFSGHVLAGTTHTGEQRERMREMYEYVALDLVRQDRARLERKAARVRLVREARPRKQRGHETQGR